MAVDYVVHYACKVKSALGNGEALRGTQLALELLKARDRAQAIAEATARKGEDPKSASIAVRETSADGSAMERQVSYAELYQQGELLKPHEPGCTDCPARVAGVPFGCFGVVNYPIPLHSEKWLMERVQPVDSVGGAFCLKAIKDCSLTGDPIKQFRAANLLESRQPVTKVMKKGWLSSVTVTSDQILQAIIGCGPSLAPMQCFGPLLWLGAVTLDGQSLSTTEQALGILKLRPQERPVRTRFDVGPRSTDLPVSALQDLLKALYCSYACDVPLLVSA